MKIYFSGAVKGGRERITTYYTMVKALKDYGEVLTEQVSDIGYTSKGYSAAKDVYFQDINWLNQSDVVVAEISTASLGVGYELAYAEKLGLRTICFYEKSNANGISSMIVGNPYFELYGYNNQIELSAKIREIFDNIKE